MKRGDCMAQTIKYVNDYDLLDRTLFQSTRESARKMVMVGYEQAMECKTKDFNSVCDRLVKKYQDETI